ncbi:signal peptidase I [Patulibacter sp.]|uniref:signal peptidase I n=1 Tax=Patulibacter sp. TaxID=1912859 RepID=UPI002727E6E5|nr:signal peptidase I [Patulibacter sp.]MDO9408926.1 signal peptidase I [Patulibacter sp.]
MLPTLKRLRRNSLVSMVFTIAVVLGLVFAVQALAVKPYQIPSESMEPTLQIGQRIVVERVGHHLGSTPSVGDVIVFHPAKDPEEGGCTNRDQGGGTPSLCAVPRDEDDSSTFVKRVVGVPGDRISLRRGRVIRNGKRASEPFIRRCSSGDDCTFTRTITVPKDTVYVLGDNRGNSEDSRYWGPVRVKWVIGNAVGTYWPPKRVGGL